MQDLLSFGSCNWALVSTRVIELSWRNQLSVGSCNRAHVSTQNQSQAGELHSRADTLGHRLMLALETSSKQGKPL